jgi:hypothetical protein
MRIKIYVREKEYVGQKEYVHRKYTRCCLSLQTQAHLAAYRPARYSCARFPHQRSCIAWLMLRPSLVAPATSCLRQ